MEMCGSENTTIYRRESDKNVTKLFFELSQGRRRFKQIVVSIRQKS